jgi:hypothetical protein
MNGAAPDQMTPIDARRLYSSPFRLPATARRRMICAGATMRACKYLPRPLRPTRIVIFVIAMFPAQKASGCYLKVAEGNIRFSQ